MSLQLPSRAAPPSTASDAWRSDAQQSTSASTSSNPIAPAARRRSSNSGGSSSGPGTGRSKTRTARPPASPFIVSGKAVSAPLLSTRSRSLAHHHAHSNASSHDEISQMMDVRRLEDMLAHNEALLSNPKLCSQLPGGIANVELRNKAMKDRLEHLYAMHAINVQLQDRVAIQEDDDPFMEDEREPAPHANDDRSLTKKEEEDDLLVKSEDQHSHHPAHSPQVQDNHHHQLRSHINGSPPLSASPTHGSPGPFHRHWKENIANRTTMVGKVGQLSMDESLSLLQTRANHRLRAQAELERLASERGVPSHLKKGGTRAIGDIQTVNANDTEFMLPEEEEDFDWHTVGYYHEDEDAA